MVLFEEKDRHVLNCCSRIIHATGLLILHPDLLLSGTLVSGSYKCARSSVIQECFGGSSNDKAVKGTLLHELMQVSS